MTRPRIVLPVITAALLVLAGCRSSPNAAGPPVVPASPASSSLPASPTATGSFATALPSDTDRQQTSPPVLPSVAASLNATDDQGDAVHLTISIDPAVVASSIDNQTIDACSDALASADSSLERSLAIPVHVSMEVTSGLPITVVVKLGDNDQLIGGGVTQPAYGIRLWAMGYSDGAACGSSEDDVTDAADVKWASAAPNQTNNFSAWLILAGAVTPADPAGDRSSLAGLLMTPLVTLAGSVADFNYVPHSSSNLVTCPNSNTYVAFEPAVATSLGCPRTK